VNENLTIRPGYLPYALTAAVALTAGSTLLGNGLIKSALICWAIIPVVAVAAMFDHIEFDGKVITHKGPLAFLLALVFRIRRRLAVADIEAITTETITFGFSSGDSRISYHTRVSGAGFEVLIRSHRKTYVPFIKALFKAAGTQKLDPRSYELFEYFEKGATLKSFPLLKHEIETMPISLLRRFGNALRLAGKLSQAASYFNIAYEKEPRNPQLLYEMSRFLRSNAQRDQKMLQRSDACLRLASKLAQEEPDLLERIGEVFFERLDYKRAGECFRRVLEFDPSRFRANVGLAEIALRDGKLAHVAHFYNAATASQDHALSKVAQREARYYQRLIGDDEFLEHELNRIRFLNHMRWARRLSALTFLLVWMIASIFGRFFQAVQNYGWALLAMTALVWLACTLTLRLYTQRRTSS
jgi:tetratricopeptide (TPR) repeat protein